jgi:hypothetical protein
MQWQYNNIQRCTTFLWRIHIAGKNETYVGFHVECPIFCSLATKFGFLGSLSPISNITKIRTMGAVLIHVDRRTDMTKLIGAFRDYENAPKNQDI